MAKPEKTTKKKGVKRTVDESEKPSDVNQTIIPYKIGDHVLSAEEREYQKRFEETKRALEQRAERLRRMSFKIQRHEDSEIENIPAYLRGGTAGKFFFLSPDYDYGGGPEKRHNVVYFAGENEEQLDPVMYPQLPVHPPAYHVQLEHLTQSLNVVNTKLEQLAKENYELKQLAFNKALGYGSAREIQTVPVEIFIDTGDSKEIFGVYEAVLNFLTVFEMDVAFEFEGVKGSWYKRMLGKTKDALTSDEVTSRLKKAEYAVEANAVLKQQSEIDKNQSEALLNIVKSLEGVANGIIRIGSLLVVKTTSEEGEVDLQVRTLTTLELHFLNSRPSLSKSPKTILFELANAVENNPVVKEIPPSS